MNWKFKEDAQPQGSSDGFWYDITCGGYVRPEEVLEDSSQVDAITAALDLLESFHDALRDNDLLNEF